MNKERILIVHNYYQVPGGEDTVVANEKKLLEDRGHEVVVYTRSNFEIKSFNKFKMLFLPFESIFSIRTYREVKKIIKEKKIDIVHVHNTLSLISQSVYYSAFACKIPVVQTIHNFRLLCPGATFYRNSNICEECIDKGLGSALKYKCYRGSFAQTLICILNLKIYKFLGAYNKLNFICLTEFNKKKLLQLNSKNKQVVNERKIYIKPHFTFDNFEHSGSDHERSLDYFLFIGRIEELKGINYLCKAFENMPDKRLVLAGSGELLDEYRSKLSTSKNITFLGQQKKKDIERLIYNAKAVIFPTQCYEGFGMVIIESFSFGTPVICSRIGNPDNLVSEGITGFKFKCDDYNEIILAINKYEDSDKNLVSTNARSQYVSNYSEEANYRVLKNIYEVVMKS